MGVYVFNKGKAQVLYGARTIQPGCYEVFPDEPAEQLRRAGFPLVFEGDPDFVPLWATNIPNQLLTTR